MKRCSICSKVMPFWQKGTVCKECEDIGKKAEVEEPVSTASYEKEQDESTAEVAEKEVATKNANDEQVNNDESFVTEKMNSEKRLDEPEMAKFLKELPYKEGEKKEAIIETESNVCVMGIPCSWKTESIFYRVKYLVNVKKVNPNNILCLSSVDIFENGYAYGQCMPFDDLKVKIVLDNANLIGISENTTIINENERAEWIKIANSDAIGWSIKDKSIVSECKRVLAKSGDYLDVLTGKIPFSYSVLQNSNREAYKNVMEKLTSSAIVMDEYIRKQREMRALDFDDLNIISNMLFSDFADEVKFDYQYIVVDDIQNIKQDQCDLLAAILKRPVNLYVTADFDQNITSMQKLNIDLFNKLTKTYHCKVFNFSTAEPNAISRFYGYPNHFVSDAHNKAILKPERDSWKGQAEEIHARTLRNLTIQICDLIDEVAEPIVYGDNDVEEHSIAIVYQDDRVADAIKKELSDINHGTLFEDIDGAKHGGHHYSDLSASDNILDRKIVKCFLAAVGMVYRDNPYDYSTYFKLIKHDDCRKLFIADSYRADATERYVANITKKAKQNHRNISEELKAQDGFHFKFEDVISNVDVLKEKAKIDAFGSILNEICQRVAIRIFGENERDYYTALSIESQFNEKTKDKYLLSSIKDAMEIDFRKTHNIPSLLNRLATYTRTPYALTGGIRFFKYPDAYGHKFTHVFLVDFHEGPCTAEEEQKREKIRKQKENMRYTAASMATDTVYFCEFDYFQGADGQKKCTLYLTKHNT